MDTLKFIANITDSLVWPAVFITGLVLFKEQIKKVILSLKFLRYKDFEVEMASPQDASDEEIRIIIFNLQRSPHSFQWFRDNTEINYTDEEFKTLLTKYPNILEPITIVSRDEEKRKSAPGLPGMRLRREYRQKITDMIQSP